MRSLYHFPAKFESEISKKSKKKDKKKTTFAEETAFDDDTQDEGGLLGNSTIVDQQGSPKQGDDKDNYQTEENEDNEELKTIMEPYSYEENHYKKSRHRIIESMRKTLGYVQKANFNHTTIDVLKHHICLRIIGDRRKLRDHPKTRNALFWNKGREALDKEMDLAYILRQVRILRYFLKTVLDKDQYCMMKMKGTALIPSTDDETKPIPGKNHKKFKKDAVLERLVTQLQRKQLSKQDFKFFEVLGFQETLKIIMEERTKLNKRNEHLNQIAGLDGIGLGEAFLGQVEANEDLVSAHLGSTNIGYSQVGRSDKAYKHTQAWQKSMQEAFRIQAFSDENGKNLTLQKKDKSDDEDSDDQPPTFNNQRTVSGTSNGAKKHKSVSFKVDDLTNTLTGPSSLLRQPTK